MLTGTFTYEQARLYLRPREPYRGHREDLLAVEARRSAVWSRVVPLFEGGVEVVVLSDGAVVEAT